MKKGLILIGLTALVVAVYFIFFSKSDDAMPEAPKQQPLAQSKNTDAFNKPFNDMLDSYFDLKNALVDWDTAKATASALKIVELSGKIPYDEIKADTTIIQTAKSYSGSVIAEAQGVAGETSIEEKRHSFYTLSENLYNLLRTVRYDQQIIYHDMCPMAFGDNDPAYWLSNSKEIVNPYLGNKHPKYHSGMIGCGSIEDSVSFTKQ
jgi:hypothetical protein